MAVSPYLGLISAVHSCIAKHGHKCTFLYELTVYYTNTHTHTPMHKQNAHSTIVQLHVLLLRPFAHIWL